MNPKKIAKITTVLVKSQLRSGRSGRASAKFFNRPSSILILDVVVFVLSAAIVSRIVQSIPNTPQFDLRSVAIQALVFTPALIPALIFIASLLFELSVSSKFAASDTLNWMPVSQAEYVTASSLSICAMYSFIVAAAYGVILPFALAQGLIYVWALAVPLGFLALFVGGLLVEMLRATLNRVSSSMLGRARRGTLFLRLVVSIFVIVVFQLFFNPLVLFSVLSSLSGSVSAAFAIPFVWPTEVLSYAVAGDYVQSALFGILSVLFAGFMVLLAVRVRSKFWSPAPVTVVVSRGEYAPSVGRLTRFGFTSVESAIIRKDFKSLSRRREMIPFLAIPVVFVAVIVLPQTLGRSGVSPAPAGVLSFPLLFLAGIYALIFSTISIGEEGKAILTLYSLPVQPGQVLRAKAAFALLFTLTVSFVLVGVASLLGKFELETAVESLVLAPALAIELTFYGLGFATRFPDFAERPRPRFIRPAGMLIAMPTGLVLSLITSSPFLITVLATSFGLELGSLPIVLVGAALVFAAVVALLSYRWALAGMKALFSEVQV
ncbi:MAG: hypothetical protein OK422_02235 [Thaumarchaeota archaeon]|nr:hypothetical protein [Nitrososphaerota archaeon]